MAYKIDFKARKQFLRNEMKRILDKDELMELDRVMRRLLNKPEPSLSELDETLAWYGLEPDYLDVYLY